MKQNSFCIRFFVKRGWIVSLLGVCSGFLSKNPLRTIVVSKAVASSVIENLSSELFDNTMIMNQIYCVDCSHKYFVFYLAGFLWYKLYGNRSKLGLGYGDDKKLVVFDSYLVTRRITRQILFVLLFLLTKNVENVY